jgi:hypothetical protein
VNMQIFYEWLTLNREGQEKYKKVMLRLTQAELSQVASIESNLGWLPWDTATREPVKAP